MIPDIVIFLLTLSGYFDIRSTYAFARTCKRALWQSDATLQKWKTVCAPLRFVEKELAVKLKFLERCQGSIYCQVSAPPVYDSNFWGVLAHGLTPVQLTLLYARVLSEYLCYEARVENNLSWWACVADCTTLLPARLPSTSGALSVPTQGAYCFVRIQRHICTGHVRADVKPLDMHAHVDLSLDDALLNRFLSHHCNLIDVLPFLPYS